MNLDDVQQALVAYAAMFDVPKERVQEAWSLDYGMSLERTMGRRLRRMLAAMELVHNATAAGDPVPAQVGLLDAGIEVALACEALDHLREDIQRAQRLDPSRIPGFYVVPRHYAYRNRAAPPKQR